MEKRFFTTGNIARSIASDFKNTNVELNKVGREIYATAISEMAFAVDGNAELSSIVKKWLIAIAKVLKDDSKEINQDDRNLYARILEVAATFIENASPRCIKASKSNYYELLNANNVEELIEGKFNKLVRLDGGEVVIFKVA